ncbi:MOSC domain-containing protein [Rhizobium sp. DKSPLA3]|uniref:MOSC domain-containing protein n=1 Tax=Rhizobium quercicola TaxID=2901226 RepID=A0A9X1NSM8_9HYPH|nr:MOSC domain-containing protein [Rhizobium quercicola]MCD7109289.1 MOSC domain-containing protein [Rhizobium quercicola]
MKSVGRIAELWRYPVSSLGGEMMDHLDVAAAGTGEDGATGHAGGGVAGNRAFLLFDPDTREPAAPESRERWRKALHLVARLRADGMAEIGFPEGTWLAADAADVEERLSQHFGFPVGLAETRGTGRSWPVIAPRYAASPLHLLTTASMTAIHASDPALVLDARRFRPDMLVDTEAASGFLENDWVGRKIVIGTLEITVTEGTKRCGMTLAAQPGLPEQPEVLRSILRGNRRNLGVYAEIVTPGRVSLGDEVWIED